MNNTIRRHSVSRHMSQEWISQSKAIRDFRINVADLHSNISKVVDGTKSKKFEGPLNEDKIKIARNPLVPLTLRLVDNPRGYEAPMRLYKISQLQQLESSLLKHAKPEQGPKKSVKKSSKKIKSTLKPGLGLKEEDSCNVSGHEFELSSQGHEVCRRCKMVVESETF